MDGGIAGQTGDGPRLDDGGLWATGGTGGAGGTQGGGAADAGSDAAIRGGNGGAQSAGGRSDGSGTTSLAGAGGAGGAQGGRAPDAGPDNPVLDAALPGGQGGSALPGGSAGNSSLGGASGSAGATSVGGISNSAGTTAGGGSGGIASSGGSQGGATAVDAGATSPPVDAGPLGPTLGTLELYGTFHAMGVIATLPEGSDGNGNATASLDYRASGATDYLAGFPLTRTGANTFIGSLFWLTPGTGYDVRVRYADPDGTPVDRGWAAATASTRAEIVIPSPTRTLVATPSGSGSTCSEAAPCGLSTALGQAQAGDEVRVTAGVHHAGGITISRSGSAGAPIVIRGETGAIIDGSDPGSFTWTAGSNGVYSTTLGTADPHLAASNGNRLYPYADATALEALSASNTPGFWANGTTINVHLAGGADPSTTTMAISRQNVGITISGNFVYLVGLTFRYFGQGDYAKAIYIRGGSDNLVQGCRFITNDLGIGIKNTAHRNVIQDNEFSDTIAGWTWEDVKAEGNLETGGVRFYDPSDGRGTVIRRNKFHNFFDGLGICPNASNAASNETDFYDNESYDLGDDGVETDGWCVNVRLWGNRLHDTLAGISLAPVMGGPVYCLRNQIFRIGAGISQGGYLGISFKLNSSDGDSGAIHLMHNTVDAQRANTSGFRIFSPGTWTQLTSRNNVFAGTSSALENSNPSQPADMDYDDLWGSGGGYLVRWEGATGSPFSTLASYTAATGQEAHGISQAPGFLAPTTFDFTPAPGSPLVDRGLVIPGINDGYLGDAPDLGAIEAR